MNGDALGRLVVDAVIAEMVSDVSYSGKLYIRELTAAIPADGATGFAKGCICIATDGTTLDNTVFLNIGTAASANFDACILAS